MEGIAGPNRRIMVDANQKFLVPEASFYNGGRSTRRWAVYWYEEPLAFLMTMPATRK